MPTSTLFELPQVRPAFGHVMVYPLRIKVARDQGFEGWASTPAVDREGEVVLPEAFAASLHQYMQNPIVTYAHDWLNPIGRTVEARASEAGLWVRIKLGRTPRAQEVWQLIEDGILRSLSIGFNASPEDGFERDGIWHWQRIELLEISIVPIPANPQATINLARGLGLDTTPPRLKLAVLQGPQAKAATAFADLPLAPEDTPWRWDVSAQDAVLGDPPDWRRYRKAHFWWDPERPETKSAYKLPFAKLIDGQLRAVWRGVASAMAALLGARGGVDIPAADRRAVYDHICRYYEKFGKTPPEFRVTWPDEVDDVRFLHGEPIIAAEEALVSQAEQIRQAALLAEGAANDLASLGASMPGAAAAAITEARTSLLRALERCMAPARGPGAGKQSDPPGAPVGQHAAADQALIDPATIAAAVARVLDSGTLGRLLDATQ